MALSTPSIADVKLIVTTTASDDTITALISDAALIVGRCSGVASQDTATQEAIIKYVVAHLLAMRKEVTGPLKSKSLGDASESYAQGGTYGQQLSSTFYGQQAILLDPTGCLATLGKTKAFVQSIGSF